MKSVAPHSIAVVIPVYRGEETLNELVSEILPLCQVQRTPEKHAYVVKEIVLVHDHGPDGSEDVIRTLAANFEVIRPVWLSRNFGQHPATIAGIAATGSDWVVTLDEDGQFNPADIPLLLDVAMNAKAPLVYGAASSSPPHSGFRNLASLLTKRVLGKLLIGSEMAEFTSFRLLLGEIGRSVAAYAGSGVYLDVALGWMVSNHRVVKVKFRSERRTQSGYTTRTLLSHFWRLVLSSGTRPLRIVSYAGVFAAIAGVVLSVLVIVRRFMYGFPVGFTSVFVLLLIIGGIMLIALGIVAEYVGLIVRTSIGRPLYLAQADPRSGPLNRAPERE
jgi:polyisoprenyl-phosphate glycosyltransferase